jgi:hypothetical protein
MNFLDNLSPTYAAKFRIVFCDVQLITKQQLESHWGDTFDEWLDLNGHLIFENLYVICFRTEFEKWMDVHDIILLEKASKNLLYALRTHRKVYPSSSCEEIVTYMKTYIEIHMEDFDTWCDGIRISFDYDERMECELAARKN